MIVRAAPALAVIATTTPTAALAAPEPENAGYNGHHAPNLQAMAAGTGRDIKERYEAAGVDILLCLINPYNVSHEDCMQTIELMGKHVIPEFEG